MEVRDPIHGAIAVTSAEERVVDHAFLQRLRNIKQVGFSELAFPGAVHSRYNHSIGVMHLAGRAFDRALASFSFSATARRDELRACLRLAALLHDVGHAPFSHCTEFAMPPLRTLGITVYDDEVHRQRGELRASHEDYTIGIVTQAMADCIAGHFPFTATHVAALISREVRIDDDFFVDGGLDLRQVLSQIVSSELDVDRLDYLVRDSYFSGARYGMVDTNWILSNLDVHVHEGRVGLALDRRALYAFDDFLIARYHMFVMVYFHHKSVVYEEMLKRYFTSPSCPYRIPSDIHAYLPVDDVHLWSHLRQSEDEWAQAIIGHRAWKRVLELHGNPASVDASWAIARLAENGIDTLAASSVGKLSRYSVFGQKRSSAPSIFVKGGLSGEAVMPLDEATAIFDRYQDERRISRVYVAPEKLDTAKALVRLD